MGPPDDFFCGKQPGVAPVFLFSNTKARLARNQSGSKKPDHRCCLTRIGRQTNRLNYLDSGGPVKRGILLRITECAAPLLSSAVLVPWTCRSATENPARHAPKPSGDWVTGRSAQNGELGLTWYSIDSTYLYLL